MADVAVLDAGPTPVPADDFAITNCTRCTDCPRCIPLHQLWIGWNLTHTRLEGELPDLMASAKFWIQYTYDTAVVPAEREVAAEQAQVTALVTAIAELTAQLAGMGALGPGGAASANVSFTFRPGWFEHVLGPGLRVWTRTEDTTELDRVLAVVGLQNALAALQAQHAAALAALQAALQRLWAAEDQVQRVIDDWNARIRAHQQASQDAAAKARAAEREHARCRCDEPADEPPGGRVALGIGGSPGGAALAAGAVMLGGAAAVVVDALRGGDPCEEALLVSAGTAPDTTAVAAAGIGVDGALGFLLGALAVAAVATRRGALRGVGWLWRGVALGVAGIAAAGLVLLGVAPASADHVAIHDRCTGVDHPPLEHPSPNPDGSVALVGLTTSLAPGSTVFGTLFGESGAAEAQRQVDAQGRVVLGFPIQAYGTYEYVVADAADPGHAVASGAIAVGPEEVPCSTGQLEPAPTAEPTPEPEPTASQPEEPSSTPTNEPAPTAPETPAAAPARQPVLSAPAVDSTAPPEPAATQPAVPAVALPATTGAQPVALGGGRVVAAVAPGTMPVQGLTVTNRPVVVGPCDPTGRSAGTTGGGLAFVVLGAGTLGLVAPRRRDGAAGGTTDREDDEEPGTGTDEPDTDGGAPVPEPPDDDEGRDPAPAGGTQPRGGGRSERELAEERERLVENERRDLERLRAATEAADRELVDEARSHVEAAEDELITATRELAELERREADEGIVESVVDWFTGADDEEELALSRARARKEAAADALRTANAALVIAETYGQDEQTRLGTVARELEEARRELNSTRRRLRTALPHGAFTIDPTDRTRAYQLARAEATLHARRIREEALLLAHTHLEPVRMQSISEVVSSTAAELERLGFEITRGRVEADVLPQVSREDEQAASWIKSMDRRHAVEQFRTLAAIGTIVDPADSSATPVDDPLRTRLAADRITWLAEYAESKAWDAADDRMRVASELREEIATTYRPFQFVGLGTISMREYFSALAHTIRRRAQETDDWFVESYLGQSSDSPDTFVEQWWTSVKTGIVTHARAANRTGDTSEAAVRSRIAAMHAEADAAVAALQSAARAAELEASPETLPKDHFELLASSGYITATPDGELRFALPRTDQLATSATSASLPGAHWLDVVSARTAGELVLSVALPELAAARIAAIATRMGTTARTVAAVRLLADHGVGVGLDAALEYARTGTVDTARLLAESLVGSALVGGARRASDRVVEAGATAVGRRRSVARGGTGRETIADLLGDSTLRAAAYRFVAETSGLAVETLVRTVQVQVTTDGGLTEEDVLAMLVSSALNRALSTATISAIRDPALLRKSMRSKLPAALAERLASNPLHVEELSASVLANRDRERAASRAFDEVVGDGPMTRETGRVVFEALREGRLTWEQLQRVYASERGGKRMDPLMREVAERRDRFFDGVVLRSRTLAEQYIRDHHRALHDELMSQPDSPVRQAELARLESKVRDELDRLDHDAPVRALEEVVRETERLDELSDTDLRDQLASQIEADFDAALTRGRDVIRPGSAGPTSDIDRSWSSEFLRRAAQDVVRTDMLRQRFGVLPPTTARAFDVNEYVNVMQAISVIAPKRRTFADRVMDSRTVDGVTVELTHQHLVEANGLASAMLHMSTAQRAQFRSNLEAAVSGDDRRRRSVQFDLALESLGRSDVILRTEVDLVRREVPADTPESEIELRARDRVYGRRMQSLVDIEQELRSVPEGSPAAKELMSRWERELNVALRDGIETYSDLTNLDIVVTRIQSQKIDGRKLKPTEIMESDEVTFRAGARPLEHVDASQVTGMFHDQVLMIFHHVHTFRTGEESPIKAVRSLAKYAERALLSLHLRGDFDAKDLTSRHRELFVWTKELMDVKEHPTKQRQALRRLAGTDDELTAVDRYLALIEGLPGLRGVTTAAHDAVPIRFSTSLMAREWARLRSQAPHTADLPVLGEEFARVVGERQALSAELARLERFASTYREQDWAAAERAEDEVAVLSLRYRLLAGPRGSTHAFVGASGQQLLQALREAQARLAQLRSRHAVDGEPSAATRRRIAWLRRRLANLDQRQQAFGRVLRAG